MSHESSDPSPGRGSTVARRGLARAVVVLVLLATTLRVLLVAMPRPDVFGPGTAEDPFIVHGEEFARGNMAAEILRGPLLPVLDYQWAPHFGGSLAVGIAAIPFYATIGETVFALKMAPIAFNALAVACLVIALEWTAGRRAAWIGGLLFAIGPPSYLVTSTIAWGVHVELNSLGCLFLAIYTGLWTGRLRRVGWWSALGAVAGFATWFGYGFALWLAAFVACEVVRDRWFALRRAFLAFAAGFALGFTPWIVNSVRHPGGATSLYGTPMAEHFSPFADFARLGSRIAELAWERLPGSFYFRSVGPIPGGLLTLAFSVLLAALVARAAWDLATRWRSLASALRTGRGEPGRISPSLYSLAFVAAFVLVFAASDFYPVEAPPDIVEYRYHLFPYPCLILLAAVGLDAMWSGARASRIGATVAAVAMTGALALATFGLYDAASWGVLARQPAHNPTAHGRWAAIRYAGEPEVLARFVDGVLQDRPAETREKYLTGMGATLVNLTSPAAQLTDEDRVRLPEYHAALEFLREYVPAEQRYFFEQSRARVRPPQGDV
jgi:hypothetical protein